MRLEGKLRAESDSSLKPCVVVVAQCVIMDDHGRSLPSFTDYGRNVERIIRHHQAIIPSYMFTCCGNVTVWGVDVQPGGGRDTTSYSFDFQVWRPSPTVSTTGCYRLVGNNRFTSISLSDSRAIATPLSRDHVQFRPGDVLGFYVEGARDNNGGVALLTQESYTNVLVWHASIEPAAVTSHSGDCPYSIGLNRVLDTSTGAAPVMSIETGDCVVSYRLL